MLNPFADVNWNPGIAERRSFAKSLAIGFPCIALILLLEGWLAGKGWNVSLALRIGGLGVAAGLLFWIVPGIARPFYVAWYAVACSFGIVVGNVLMAIVFYGLVTALGLSKRAFGPPLIRKTPDRRGQTYWKDAEPSLDAKRYFSQF